MLRTVDAIDLAEGGKQAGSDDLRDSSGLAPFTQSPFNFVVGAVTASDRSGGSDGSVQCGWPTTSQGCRDRLSHRGDLIHDELKIWVKYPAFSFGDASSHFRRDDN